MVRHKPRSLPLRFSLRAPRLCVKTAAAKVVLTQRRKGAKTRKVKPTPAELEHERAPSLTVGLLPLRVISLRPQ
jgi:hypothetical protein